MHISTEVMLIAVVFLLAFLFLPLSLFCLFFLFTERHYIEAMQITLIKALLCSRGIIHSYKYYTLDKNNDALN